MSSHFFIPVNFLTMLHVFKHSLHLTDAALIHILWKKLTLECHIQKWAEVPLTQITT